MTIYGMVTFIKKKLTLINYMQITEVSIIYFIFRLFLFVVAVWNGYILSHKDRKLKISDFSPIIFVYTLYSGLRWGRGVDYNFY